MSINKLKNIISSTNLPKSYIAKRIFSIKYQFMTNWSHVNKVSEIWKGA